MLPLLIVIALALFVAERLWPAREQPRVTNWWARVIFVNTIQLGIIILAGYSWDRWLQESSLLSLRDHLPVLAQGVVAYVFSTFVYYWWHRWRHESAWFWRICHQLHHSPRRIELVTSFYKHPVEITINSMLSAGIVYLLLGCSVEAGAIYTFLTAGAEYFYHLNLRTPHWVGYFIQRPESHRIHHQYQHHTQNFADLPVWDALFGTFRNPRPRTEPSHCGYDEWREDRFDDMLAFRDVNATDAETRTPLHLLPTCIGCSKRWVCTQHAAPPPGESPSAK
ncbi:MAG: sterol desaturase family protein [Candidatus Didemnitutus sp.]|nr:sterol desaturase family protein [Candidatus Didemnitutus sp.]